MKYNNIKLIRHKITSNVQIKLYETFQIVKIFKIFKFKAKKG